MSRRITLALTLALLAPLTACDEGDGQDVETRAIEDFEDGLMACDSDHGAFRVTLWSESGSLEVGRNDLVLRLGFHHPSDPLDPGVGIPDAKVDLDAWMPGADQAMATEPVISYTRDGQYVIENVVLPEQGVWNFDFEVRVGENMVETISLAFEVE